MSTSENSKAKRKFLGLWVTIKDNDDALEAALAAKSAAYYFSFVPIFVLALKLLFDINLFTFTSDIWFNYYCIFQAAVMFLVARRISPEKIGLVPFIFAWALLEVCLEPKPISIFFLIYSFNCLRGYLKLKKISFK